MNKKLSLVMSGVVAVVVAVLALLWLSPKPVATVATKTNTGGTSISAQTEPASLKPDTAIVQDADPYGSCSAQSSSVLDDEQELATLLLALLSAGKTPAELLQYNVSAAVWPGRYAESIAKAKQQLGLRQLNIQEPSMLNKLSQRLEQDLTDNPLDVAKRLAEQDEFQSFVSIGMGTWGGSMLISPSLLLMQLSPQLPIADFRQIIAGKSFLPLEIAVAMQARASDEHLLALIAQSRDIDQFPTGFELTGGVAPVWNLADVAAALWHPAALKALKQLGVTPTNIEGVVTGLDYALFANHRTLRSTHKDPALEQASQSDLQQAQQQTVAYLIDEGFWAHGRQLKSGNWSFGNFYLNTGNLRTNNILALLPAGKPELFFRNLGLPNQPVPPDQALATWLTKIADAKAAANTAYTVCSQQKQQLRIEEGLLSEEQIIQQMSQWRGEQAAEATAIAPMQLQDPAWVAWHWRMGGAREQQSDEQHTQQLADMLDKPAAMQDFLQKTALDSATTAWLLMELRRKPELLPLFNQRYNPVAPDFIYPVFWNGDAAALDRLKAAGYDFKLQDRHGRNLYLAAFKQSPDAVLFLLAQDVSPLSQQIGPDALDLALEFSYRQSNLHPALPRILEQVSDFEPSHLARLKRLQQYRPTLYQQVLQLKPKLQLPADISPNELLTPLDW